MTLDAPRDPEMTLIHGVDSCEDTTRARERFDAAGRRYRYVDLDADPATRQRLHDVGLVATPVVVTPAGDVFVEPSDADLTVIIASTAA